MRFEDVFIGWLSKTDFFCGSFCFRFGSNLALFKIYRADRHIFLLSFVIFTGVIVTFLCN